jgi:GxxExxY protein
MTAEDIHHRGTEDAEGAQRGITEEIIVAALEVHSVLGAGLLESVYQSALQREFQLRGIQYSAQVAVPIAYKDHKLDTPLRLDLLVRQNVVVEVKAVEAILPIHHAQLLTYLRLTQLQVGLILNFNTPHLRHGIKRVINTKTSLRPSASSVPLR